VSNPHTLFVQYALRLGSSQVNWHITFSQRKPEIVRLLKQYVEPSLNLKIHKTMILGVRCFSHMGVGRVVLDNANKRA